MIIEVGAAGGFNIVLEKRKERFALKPQAEENLTRMLSPAPAAALLLKDRINFCAWSEPESMVAEPPNTPTIDQFHPVAAPAVVVAKGKLGAEYR